MVSAALGSIVLAVASTAMAIWTPRKGGQRYAFVPRLGLAAFVLAFVTASVGLAAEPDCRVPWQGARGWGAVYILAHPGPLTIEIGKKESWDASIARFTLERPGMEWVLLGSAGGCWVSEEHGSLGWDPIASGFILGAIRGVCGIAHRVGASEGHSIPRHGGPCQPGAQHMHHATPGLPP